MESKIEEAGLDVAADVLSEAVDELTGVSKRTWAVILLAFLLGSAATAMVIRALRKRAAATVDGSDAATPSAEADTDTLQTVTARAADRFGK